MPSDAADPAPLAFHARVLRLLGAAPDARGWTRVRLAVSASIMLGIQLSWYYFIAAAAGDLEALTDGLGIGLLGVSSGVRFAALASNARRFAALRRAFAAAPAPPAAVEALERRARQVTLSFIAVYFVVTLFFIILPWMVLRDPETGLPPLLMPFLLPVDSSTPLGYAITFIWHWIGGVVHMVMIPTVDYCNAALMEHAALRLRAVAEDLRALRPGDAGVSGEGVRLRLRLRRCVRAHQVALQLVSDVDRLLNGGLGVQVLSSSFIFCSVAYRVTRAGVTVPEIASKCGLVAPVLLQLFIICLFGQRVREQGDAVAAAAWACGWECDGAPPELRTPLRMVLLRAQRPARITALRIAEVSLDTFGEVMKLSYSYYNLLNEVGE